MPTVDLFPINGTLVRSANPAFPYWEASKSLQRLELNATVSLLKFVLPADLIGSQVGSAILTLVPAAADGASVGTWPSLTVTAHRHTALAAGTYYANVDWNHRPTKLTGATDATYTGTGPALLELRAELQSVADGGAYFGFRIIGSNATFQKFYGWQAADGLIPKLTLAYTRPGDPPSGLGPNGVVSIAKPWFTWHGNPDATTFRLQVSTVSDFSTIAVDSGTQTSAAQGWDSSTGTWSPSAGIAANGTVYARVNNDGGAWSDIATTTRRAFPTVAFTSPAAVAGEATPPNQWTVTGSEAQTAFRLSVADLATTYYDSNVVAGASGSVTPTAGPVENAAVTSTLRTYFGSDRVASPGDPNYVTTLLNWKWSSSNSLTPANSFAILQANGSPQVSFSFKRATAPDEWIIDSGGKQVLRFDAGDYKSGATWTVPTWLVSPNSGPQVFGVSPVENHQVGPRVTVTATPTATGVWLVDPTSGRSCSVAGDSPDVAYVEGVATLTAIDGTQIVHTYGLGGLAGTVFGQVFAYAGRSVAAQVTDLLVMKVTPERVYRMIWGDLNIPVRVNAVSPKPTGNSDYARTTEVVYDAGWAFRQVGEYEFPNP